MGNMQVEINKRFRKGEDFIMGCAGLGKKVKTSSWDVQGWEVLHSHNCKT